MMTRVFVLAAVVASMFVVSPVPAEAQGVAASRVFAGGIGGVTFGDVDTGGFGGVRVGIRVAPGVHIVLEGGEMSDVMPSSVRDEIDDLIAEISAEAGEAVSLSMKVPAAYGFGGIRWTGAGRVSPFVEVGGGAADLSPDVDAFTVGGVDFTSTFTQFLAEEEDLEMTARMLVVSGGINAAVSRLVSIDAGYRFTRIFTEDPAVNVSSAQVAVNFGW